MRASRLVLVTATALWLWPAGLHAQSEALKEAYSRGVGARVRRAGGRRRTPFTVTMLSYLGNAYRRQHRYAEAESLYQRVLSVVEKTLGPEHPQVATAADNLAGLYRDAGRYAEAVPLLERALAISEKASGPEHPQIAALLNNLGLVLYQATSRHVEVMNASCRR